MSRITAPRTPLRELRQGPAPGKCPISPISLPHRRAFRLEHRPVAGEDGSSPVERRLLTSHDLFVLSKSDAVINMWGLVMQEVSTGSGSKDTVAEEAEIEKKYWINGMTPDEMALTNAEGEVRLNLADVLEVLTQTRPAVWETWGVCSSMIDMLLKIEEPREKLAAIQIFAIAVANCCGSDWVTSVVLTANGWWRYLVEEVSCSGGTKVTCHLKREQRKLEEGEKWLELLDAVNDVFMLAFPFAKFRLSCAKHEDGSCYAGVEECDSTDSDTESD